MMSVHVGEPGTGASVGIEPTADFDTFAHRCGPDVRRVLVARYGLDGHDPLTVREIQHGLGLQRDQLRIALGDGLAKLRAQVV